MLSYNRVVMLGASYVAFPNKIPKPDFQTCFGAETKETPNLRKTCFQTCFQALMQRNHVINHILSH